MFSEFRCAYPLDWHILPLLGNFGTCAYFYDYPSLFGLNPIQAQVSTEVVAGLQRAKFSPNPSLPLRAMWVPEKIIGFWLKFSLGSHFSLAPNPLPPHLSKRYTPQDLPGLSLGSTQGLSLPKLPRTARASLRRIRKNDRIRHKC